MDNNQSLKHLTNEQLVRRNHIITNEMLTLSKRLYRETDLPIARKGLMKEFYRYQDEIERRNIEW